MKRFITMNMTKVAEFLLEKNLEEKVYELAPNPTPGPRNHPAQPWCVCRHCRVMPTQRERVCCGKTVCITGSEAIQNGCLDRHIAINCK